MRSDEIATEARRVLDICDACGYCNGFCDLFEAARRRPALSDGDLAHLANLCHACRNCLYACQYAPPHVFQVNVPRTLARLRQRTYAEYVWPKGLAFLLDHGRLSTLIVTLAATALMIGLVLTSLPPETLFDRHLGTGAFYRILPWETMAWIGAIPLGWSALAIGIGLRRYWRATRPGSARVTSRAFVRALRDVVLLRNLQGGGPGCNDLDDRPSHARRRLHQTLAAGVLLSLAATLVATLYHHALGWEAPYPALSAPVALGTLGGVCMTVGAIGLLWLKRRGDQTPTAPESRRADAAILGLLLWVALTGLALLIWRETGAMGILLAIHLGGVLALFILLPYSKLVHAGYRFISLLIEAMEQASGRKA
ncbi:tricarballylate utilization 4Fe-4S protein TcuB [Imhoffiella purpurea]|uniref:TcuB: works with TcuA to oxidize tricarballylate to cis-aconitate n=1 Tax=Imhoffiella purpurea TaxID=1249627 RepID=W9W359_9GAMM|nr:tricarballylate utilization 4Fe-4S protein TcuB [Imhoffiella purpurea]EXJ17010.1 TcuB: works with TcuA to oxidize tricarballylate to cis-aconitate [Imhoffiella purpurea]